MTYRKVLYREPPSLSPHFLLIQVSFEEFVQSKLSDSHLMKPLLTLGGWWEEIYDCTEIFLSA